MADTKPTAGKQRSKQAKPPAGPSYKELEAQVAALTQANTNWQVQNLRLQAWCASLLVAQAQSGWASFPDLMAQAQQDTVTQATVPKGDPPREDADEV
jgi:hypothetical protein